MEDTSPQRPPYWRLISILASTMPLNSKVAMWLYDAAVVLHECDGASLPLSGDFAEGQLRNLRKELLLGSFGGPGFEATVETGEGRAMVRFIVTREGLEARGDARELDAALAPPAVPRHLMN